MDNNMDKVSRFKSRVDHSPGIGKMVAASAHNAPLTGSTEDLVTENDYRRKIAELELIIATLKGQLWGAEEEIKLVSKQRDMAIAEVKRLEKGLKVLGTIFTA